MGIMTDQWTIFGADRGQIVEHAYRLDEASNRLIRRTIDRADNRVTYSATQCSPDIQWNGSEGIRPFLDHPFAIIGHTSPFGPGRNANGEASDRPRNQNNA